MLFTIIAILIIIYILTLAALIKKRKLSIRATKTLRISLFILAPVLITTLILNQYNIYPRGYWFTKGLLWIVVFSMMILFGLGNKSTMNGWERAFYGFIFFIPLGFIPLMLIPLLAVIFAIAAYVSLIGDKSFIIYSDSNIRIEKTHIRFLGPDPPLQVYVKHGLFSYKDTLLPIEYDDKDDRVQIKKLDDSTYLLTHYSLRYMLEDSTDDGIEEYKFSVNP